MIKYEYTTARTTGDMDVWLNPTNQNKELLLKVLEKERILQEDLNLLLAKDFTQMTAFHIGSPPFKIDFVTKISNVTFSEADKQKVFFEVDGIKIPVIHYNHLISSKISSERAKDKADVEELQKINSLKKKD